ncbi:MAG TPA: DUF4240 domain-containing protein [Micromonosporaceae bacterium]
MNLDQFWATVESARAGTAETLGDGGKALASALVSRLAATSPDEIVSFQVQFERALSSLFRWDVWAAAHLIGAGCSIDSFIDFRAGVIGLGRDWFERTVANPDNLADHPVVRYAVELGRRDAVFAELVAYVGPEAYEVISGDGDAFFRAMDKYAASGGQRFEPKIPMGEQFDFADQAQLRARLPRLSTLYLTAGNR